MLVGIDLGTTNSAIAYWDNDKPALISNALGDVLTPSAVSFTEDDQLLVGMAARERQVTHPHLSATNFKRLMGTKERLKLGNRQFTPEELSSLVLSAMKADAEAHLDTSITGAIITVPAYFNDKQRRATRTAGELAGLKVERLINEPTAAALAHGIHQLDNEEPFLIFDLGGGTFDVSLVEIFDGIIEVRASAGDNRLGGEDFNELVAQIARRQIDPWNSIADKDKDEFREAVRAAAERTRRTLSVADDGKFEISWRGKKYSTSITSLAFEEEAKPILDRLREPVRRSLSDSGIPPSDLGKIILVGGSTRMPIIRRAVTKMFGRFPDTSLDADCAVALGAAVQAGLQQRNAALDEVRLTDVCPFTLGIETSTVGPGGKMVTGLFSPIIERNTVIPASRVQIFSPMEDNQRQVDVRIYQGESRQVDGNVFLKSISIPLPKGSREDVYFEVRFSYDVSGLLEVDIKIPNTGAQYQIVIKEDNLTLDDNELAIRRADLAKLKVHPREDAQNAAVIARSERCYQDSIGERREWVGTHIAQFLAILDAQEPRCIAEARSELVRALNELEGERIL